MAKSNTKPNKELWCTHPNARVYSPMLEALVKGNTQRVKLLLKVGVSPNQRDAIGRTPLIIVSYYTNEVKARSLAEYLVKLGGKIDYADDSGMNSLHHACEKGRVKLVETLLKYKDDYDISVKDKLGKTCFDYAEISGCQNISRKLKSIANEYCLDPSIYINSRATPKENASSPRMGVNEGCNDFKNIDEAKVRIQAVLENNVSNAGEKERTITLKKMKNARDAKMMDEDTSIEDINIDQEIIGLISGIKIEAKKANTWIAEKQKDDSGIWNLHNLKIQQEGTIPTTEEVVPKAAGNLLKAKKKKSPPNERISHVGCQFERENKRFSSRKRTDLSKTESDKVKKPGKHRSSKVQLVEMFKIFEQQSSMTYREVAKKRIIPSHRNSVSSNSSVYPEEDESPRIPSGRSSRSMSLVPGSQINLNAGRKRRPSRVINLHHSLQLGDMIKTRPKRLNQRRFSTISAPTFALEQPMHSSNAFPLSASSLPFVRKFNFDRPTLLEHTGEERRTPLAKNEKGLFRSTSSQNRISMLPSLQAFIETGEGAEGIDIFKGSLE